MDYGIGNREEGACLVHPTQFNPDCLVVVTAAGDKKTVLYNNDFRLYIKSDIYTGFTRTYKTESTNSVRILVQISEIMRTIRDEISKKAGTRTSFYARDDAAFVGCYLDTVMNSEGVKCVNAVDKGTQKLLPIDELHNKQCSFYCILQSRSLKRSEKTDLLNWSLSVSEINIFDAPRDYSASEPVATGSKIKFCTMHTVD